MLKKWRHRKKCKNLASSCDEPVMVNYLEQCAEMSPGRIDSTPLIAADLELTGLEPAWDQIISIGWTRIDSGRVRMGENRHLLVNAGRSVGSSAAIHELTDTEVATGIDIEAALKSLFVAAAGRIWIFHHAPLDVAFLQRACLDWCGLAPPFMVLDTMQIELGLRQRRNLPVQQGDLQLTQLRADYHLPRYTAHDALIDACATAELMLAIAARLDRERALDLTPFLRFT